MTSGTRTGWVFVAAAAMSLGHGACVWGGDPEAGGPSIKTSGGKGVGPAKGQKVPTAAAPEPRTIPGYDYRRSPFGMNPGVVSAEESRSHYGALGVRWLMNPIILWMGVQKNLADPALSWSQPQKGGPSIDENILSAPPWVINVPCLWAAPNPREGRYVKKGSYAPADPAAYAAFVRATVERYDGDGVADLPGLRVPIKCWEVGNEPIEAEGKGYDELLRVTYLAVKEADPEAKVFMAGTYGSPEVCQDYFDRLHRRFLAALGGRYLDGLNLHWYGHAYGDYRRLKDFYGMARRCLAANRYPDSTEIWVSEMGTFSGSWAVKGKVRSRFQSEELHAADVLKRHVYSLHLGVKRVFLAMGLMEGWEMQDGYFDHTGLIYDGKFADDRGHGTKKLAYYTYQMMTEKLEGSDWNRIDELPAGPRHTYAYRFRRPDTGKSVLVAWWDWFDEFDKVPPKATKALSLPVSTPRVTVTVAVTDENGRRRSWVQPAEDGRVALALGEYPVFIEE